MAEQEKIFLYDSYLYPWETPTRSGRVNELPVGCKPTILTKSFGIERVHETFGPYVVDANAAKYLATINTPATPYSAAKQPGVLFNGNLSIYQNREMADGFEGLDLVFNGRIWVATKQDKIYQGERGLFTLIFGQGSNEEKKGERIEAIIEGYQHQEARPKIR